MIFVDTGAWFACVVPWDANHAAATAWMNQNREPLITTDFVLDETLTLLRARNETPRAVALGDQLLIERWANLHFVSEEEIREAWQVFRTYADKEWSFTDCTSKVVIEKLGLTAAFSFDHHFRQFGAIRVVP